MTLARHAVLIALHSPLDPCNVEPPMEVATCPTSVREVTTFVLVSFGTISSQFLLSSR